MTRPSSQQRPRRCVVLGPRRLTRLLWHRGVFSSLVASPRVVVAVTHGEPPKADHAGVLEPTLMRWRLEHTPDDLDAPLSLGRNELNAERLRGLELDEAVILGRRWSDFRLAAAAGIGQRWAYSAGVAGWLANQRVSRPDPGDHVLDRDRALVEAMGVAWRPMPTLDVTNVWRQAGPNRLQAAKLDLAAPLIGIHLGDTEGRGAPWPGEAFEDLARRLRRARPAVGIAILATERELWQSVLLFERTGKIHPVIGPDLALDGLAAVLARLDLVVASDSVLLHLAAAVGAPTLGLFTRERDRRAPRGEQHQAIERRRLKRLSVDEVLGRCLDVLDAAAERPRAQLDGKSTP